MNEELKKLLDNIKDKKQEVRDLCRARLKMLERQRMN